MRVMVDGKVELRAGPSTIKNLIRGTAEQVRVQFGSTAACKHAYSMRTEWYVWPDQPGPHTQWRHLLPFDQHPSSPANQTHHMLLQAELWSRVQGPHHSCKPGHSQQQGRALSAAGQPPAAASAGSGQACEQCPAPKASQPGTPCIRIDLQAPAAAQDHANPSVRGTKTRTSIAANEAHSQSLNSFDRAQLSSAHPGSGECAWLCASLLP